MKLEELLIEYGQLKNLGKVELSEFGVCRLSINQFLIISFEKTLNEAGFFIYSMISTLNPESEKQVCMMALSGNLFGKETGHANLGYSEGTHSLILFEYFDELNLTFLQFSERLEKFIQYASYWIAKIENANTNVNQNLPKEYLENTGKNMKIFFG